MRWQMANDSQYGLTGAVYSHNAGRTSRSAREEFLRRQSCTSTANAPARWWERIPFGGFNMSGTDSKAGGPDYLLLFLQAKSIAEKL